MQQLVIKDGLVIATHALEQDLSDLYPGAAIILHRDMDVGPGDIDPRTREEKWNNYANKRRMEYPSIPDQLDAMYWDRVNGIDCWVQTIHKIKTSIPKPEERDATSN